ncbi:MAG: LysR family transcriptional regulator [Ruegeria sp.]|uniref:LysR family transcriptional regulator n=1 Tax=Ruegeria sp. TaxID=1879320 RepID=UPI00349E6B0A
MNVRDLDWTALAVFRLVAELGTLSAAAERLNISQPTAGRMIARLEASLGLRLFDHGRRGYQLTEAGRELLEPAEALLVNAEGFRRFACGLASAPQHRQVRIALGEWMLSYAAQHIGMLGSGLDGLSLQLMAEDRYTALPLGEVDIALRNRAPTEPQLSGEKLGTASRLVYAAAAYVEQHPECRDPETWGRQIWVGYGSTRPAFGATRWLDRVLQGRAPHVVVNRSTALLDVARSGQAMAILPGWIAEFEPLCRLSAQPEAGSEMWIVHRADLEADPVLRRIRNRLRDLFVARLNEAAARLTQPPSRN